MLAKKTELLFKNRWKRPKARSSSWSTRIPDWKIAAATCKGRACQTHPPPLRYGRRDPGHLPEADQLPKTQFYCLMERVFALPEVRRLVQQAQEEG